jgi:hypothetical protein
MPFKDPFKKLKYARELYKKQSKLAVLRVAKRKKKIKNWLEEYKKNLKCFSCGESHPATLDFHHKNKHEKEKSICYLVVNGYSVNKIINELNKCEVLCANCHRKLHHKTAIFKRA